MFNRDLNGKKISETKKSRMEAPLKKYKVSNYLNNHQEAQIQSKTAA